MFDELHAKISAKSSVDKVLKRIRCNFAQKERVWCSLVTICALLHFPLLFHLDMRFVDVMHLFCPTSGVFLLQKPDNRAVNLAAESAEHKPKPGGAVQSTTVTVRLKEKGFSNFQRESFD